jgi:hypothetical protein
MGTPLNQLETGHDRLKNFDETFAKLNNDKQNMSTGQFLDHSTIFTNNLDVLIRGGKIEGQSGFKGALEGQKLFINAMTFFKDQGYNFDKWDSYNLRILKDEIEEMALEEDLPAKEKPTNYDETLDEFKKMVFLYYSKPLGEAKDQMRDDFIVPLLDDLETAALAENSGEYPERFQNEKYGQWSPADFLELQNKIENITYLGLDEDEQEEYEKYLKGDEEKVAEVLSESTMDTNKRVAESLSQVAVKRATEELLGKKIYNKDIYDAPLRGEEIEVELSGGPKVGPLLANLDSAFEALFDDREIVGVDVMEEIRKSTDSDGRERFFNSLHVAFKDLIRQTNNYNNSEKKLDKQEAVRKIFWIKARFLQGCGLRAGLAEKAYMDALLNLSVAVQNPSVDMANPGPKVPENVYQEFINNVHVRLADSLIEEGFIVKRSELKFVNSVNTPLDFAAGYDSFFVANDIVMPVDFTMRTIKSASDKQKIASYGSVLFFHNQTLERTYAKNNGVTGFVSELKKLLYEEGEKFIVKSVEKAREGKRQKDAKMIEGDFNYSGGISGLIDSRKTTAATPVSTEKSNREAA